MLKANENLLDDINVFFQGTTQREHAPVLIAQVIVCTIFIGETSDIRKQVAKECTRHTQKIGFLNEFCDAKVILNILNPNDFLRGFFSCPYNSEDGLRITEKILSCSSLSEISNLKHNLRSDDMTIIDIVFLLICLAAAWHFFLRRQNNSSVIKAERFLRSAMTVDPRNASWCKKIIQTFGASGWDWYWGLSHANLSRQEQSLMTDYFLSNHFSDMTVERFSPDKGMAFDATTMKADEEELPFVYDAVVAGLKIDGKIAMKSIVSCSTSDFLTVDGVNDQKLTDYCRNEDPEAFKSRKIRFTPAFCDAMSICFKENLQDLIQKISATSYDKNLKMTEVNVGSEFDIRSMDAEELTIPENAVVARILCQGLMRGNEVIVKPKVSIMERR